MLGICVEQPSNHALILRVVFLCLGLEKVNATLAQCDSDLDPIVLKYKVFRSRKDVSYDPGVSEWFVRVLDFRAHRFVYPSANN